MSEIVYRRRGLSWLYYFFVVAFAVLGILFLLIAFGESLGAAPWRDKFMGVAGFGLAALSWLLGTTQMWSMGKSYGKNEVRITESAFSLHTPGGHDIQFQFADVRQVNWNPGLRYRICTVETDTLIYTFDQRSCPSTGKVAYLVAERSGQPLRIVDTKTSTAPSRSRL